MVATISVCTPLTIQADTLNPTAPPGNTMKTLQEVQPRRPLGQADFPLTITQAGSYYLTENITITDPNTHGMTITANDVALDLMGFSLTGPGSNGNGSGIYMNGRKNIDIKNGTIQKFSVAGIIEENIFGFGHRIVGVKVKQNGQRGISLNCRAAIVQACIVTHNGNQSTADVYGIYGLSDIKVIDNICNDNGFEATSTVYGIYVYDNCVVSGNHVSNNGTFALYAIYGIHGNDGTKVENNIVSGNGIGGAPVSTVYGIYNKNGTTIGNIVKDNGNGRLEPAFNGAQSVYGIYIYNGSVTKNTIDNNGYLVNGVHGIYAFAKGHISKNTVSNNGGGPDDGLFCLFCSGIFGISANDGSSVIDNHVFNNGINTLLDVKGIHVGEGCVVTNNNCSDNGGGAVLVFGISTDSGCIITNNSCFNNGFDARGNVYGISANSNCVISGNVVSKNGLQIDPISNNISVWGLKTTAFCTISRNTISNNGISDNQDVWGIETGDYCMLEANTANNNGVLQNNITTGSTGCILISNITP